MTATLILAARDLVPEAGAVLGQLGIPPSATVSERTAGLLAEATALFSAQVAPAGVYADVTPATFAEVFRGEGRNAPASPVELVAGRAEYLALFAVTLGPAIGDAIARLFDQQDFALACTLDAMASVAADAAAEMAERQFEASLRRRGWATQGGVALRYSPGYCGWDVTGQRRLFAALAPGTIELTLTDSCLMQPLKSVSGVLLAGPRAIHRFRTDYDFCERCEDRTCRDRLAALYLAARS